MRGRRSTEGIAIITAISFMVVTLAFISTAFIVSISNTRLSGDQVSTTKAQLAAQAGIDEALLRVWHAATEDINTNGAISGRRDIPDYRLKWEDITNWSSYNWDTSNQLLPAQDGNGGTVLGEFGDPVSFSNQIDNGIGSVMSYEVTIERRDDSEDSSTLRITSTGTLPNGSKRRLQQELSVAYPPFQLDFALLTDFVNCTFCHSAFTSIEMAYDPNVGMANRNFLVDLTNEDARKTASEGKQRIRVAGLNNMEISTGFRALNTLVAGTIYTRGPQNIMRRDSGQSGTTGPKENVWGPVYRPGSPLISDLDWEGFRPDQASVSVDALDTCTKDINDGNADCTERFSRFYENYPLEIEGSAPPIDGIIPAVQQFPSPIKDLNNDRRIDNSEWAETIGSRSLGSLNDAAEIWFSPTDDEGIPNGSGNTQLPFQVRGETVNIPGLQAGGVVTEPDRGIAGNLFLIGTDSNPIEIEGTVYIDGDLVIQGPIAPGNRGVLMVRKNIYILGDVVYDCNGKSAGTRCTYYEPSTLPRLAFVSGGLMVIGDANQSSQHRGFPDDFGTRFDHERSRLPLQGELLAFNDKQHDKYQEARKTARTLEDSFVPRYYLYREGDELVMRCNFAGDDGPDNDPRGGVRECRDFESRQGSGDKLSARENIPCIAGQFALFDDLNDTLEDDTDPNNDQPVCVSRIENVAGTNRVTAIAIDLDGDGAFTDGFDAIVQTLSYDSDGNLTEELTIDNAEFQAYRDLTNTDFDWGMESRWATGAAPVEQYDDNANRGLSKLVGEIFVRDRNNNIINDANGDPVEPAYIYKSPNKSWLAPDADFNNNNIADNIDLSLTNMDKAMGRQNAIAAMEVLTGAWVEYGLANGRSQDDKAPIQIDGLLYTNNAIFSYLPNRRSRTFTGGGLIVNGSIISYETGLLVYGTGENDCRHGNRQVEIHKANNWRCMGLRVQYDRRLPSLIDVRIEVPVLLRARSQWLEILD